VALKEEGGLNRACRHLTIILNKHIVTTQLL